MLVRSGRLVARCASMAKSLAHGELSTGHVEAWARHVTPPRADLFDDQAEALVDATRSLSVDQTADAARRWASWADDQLNRGEPEDLHGKRGVWFGRTGDLEMSRILGSPEELAALKAALDQLEPPDPKHTPGGARTLAQRRYDALVDAGRPRPAEQQGPHRPRTHREHRDRRRHPRRRVQPRRPLRRINWRTARSCPPACNACCAAAGSAGSSSTPTVFPSTSAAGPGSSAPPNNAPSSSATVAAAWPTATDPPSGATSTTSTPTAHPPTVPPTSTTASACAAPTTPSSTKAGNPGKTPTDRGISNLHDHQTGRARQRARRVGPS